MRVSKVRIVQLDGTETVTYFPIEAYSILNDGYGDMVQDGWIKTVFIEAVDVPSDTFTKSAPKLPYMRERA